MDTSKYPPPGQNPFVFPDFALDLRKFDLTGSPGNYLFDWETQLPPISVPQEILDNLQNVEGHVQYLMDQNILAVQRVQNLDYRMGQVKSYAEYMSHWATNLEQNTQNLGNSAQVAFEKAHEAVQTLGQATEKILAEQNAQKEYIKKLEEDRKNDKNRRDEMENFVLKTQKEVDGIGNAVTEMISQMRDTLRKVHGELEQTQAENLELKKKLENEQKSRKQTEENLSLIVENLEEWKLFVEKNAEKTQHDMGIMQSKLSEIEGWWDSDHQSSPAPCPEKSVERPKISPEPASWETKIKQALLGENQDIATKSPEIEIEKDKSSHKTGDVSDSSANLPKNTQKRLEKSSADQTGIILEEESEDENPSQISEPSVIQFVPTPPKKDSEVQTKKDKKPPVKAKKTQSTQIMEPVKRILFEDEEEVNDEIVHISDEEQMMKGHGDANTGLGLAPMLAIWGGVEAPKFSGKMEDWVDFATLWKRYIQLYEESLHQKIPEVLKLEMLQKSLDEDNRYILQASLEEHVTYEDFWTQLEKGMCRTVWNFIVGIGKK